MRSFLELRRKLLPLLLLLTLLEVEGKIQPLQHQQQQQNGGSGGGGSLVMVHDDEGSSSSDASRAQSCTPAPIEVSICQGMHYNLTARHLQGDSKQPEVGMVLKQLEDLIRVPCAPFMKLFVCSMHLPLCNEAQSLLVRPCKEFCLRIQGLCTPLLRHFGHGWPQSLACDGLANERDQGKSAGLCLRPSSREFEEELQRLREGNSGVSQINSPHPSQPANQLENPPYWSVDLLTTPAPLPPASAAPRRPCSAAEVRVGPETMLGGAGGSGSGASTLCAQRCSAHLLFTREDKAFASTWMRIWSGLCLASTVLAVATFALDSDRFRFPERPIVWVAGCYLLFSAAHLLRAALGPELACGRHAESAPLHRVTRHAGHWCAVVFLLLYFSSTAGCFWWLILTVCWYLCAAKKWAHEALAYRTMWLHVFGWGCPLLLSVVLLVLHRIEADELTHLCVVDASNRINLLLFVIAPVSLSLLVGLCFLICAFCSTVSVRHSLKWSGNSGFRRLEKLMTKIGLFSFLFLVPTVCVLAANVYEFLERDKWAASLEKVLSHPGCVNSSGLLLNSQQLPDEARCTLEHRPSSAFYMLKIFMSLAAGLPSGLIVWFNYKSLAAWHRCFGKRSKCCLPGVDKLPENQQFSPQLPHQQQQQQQPMHLHQASSEDAAAAAAAAAAAVGVRELMSQQQQHIRMHHMHHSRSMQQYQQQQHLLTAGRGKYPGSFANPMEF